MTELDNLAVQGTPLAADLRACRARADDALAEPAGVQPLRDDEPAGARQRLGGRPQRASQGPRRDQAARQVREEVIPDRRRPQRSSCATSTIPTAPSKSTHAPPATAAARRRPATPAWRGCSTTSTTRPSRSTSTTRSATCCTSRSSRSRPVPAPTTTPGVYNGRGRGPQRRRLRRDHRRPRGEPLRRLARRPPAGHQRATQPAALRPVGLPGRLDRHEPLRPGRDVTAAAVDAKATDATRTGGRRRLRADGTATRAARRRQRPRAGGQRPRHRRPDGPRRRRRSRPCRTPRRHADRRQPAAPAAAAGNSDLLGYLFGN